MAKIKVKRGLEENIGTISLDDGEFAITTNTKKLYVGIAGAKICLGGASSLGDMLKSIYDTDNDGIVDSSENSDMLDGQHGNYYLNYTNLANKPTSLPANGGNADTVNGKHATDFTLSSTVGHLTGIQLNNCSTLFSGIYSNCGDGILNIDGTVFKAGWWHVIHCHHSDGNGFDAQISLPLSGEDNIYYRHAQGGVWGSWKLQWDNSNFIPSNYMPKGPVIWNNLRGV